MGSTLIKISKHKYTAAQWREFNAIEKENSRRWRNFHVRVLKSQGYSNVQIAKDLEISESTVRVILKA